MKQNYPTNLTDSQYNTILRIIGDKRKRKCSLRSVFDAVFYLLKTGCPWRMLPADVPSWKLVYYYFCKWSRDGTLEELNDVLRDCLRKKRGCKRSPSVGIIDSQSIKTTCVGGENRGVDGGKKIKGRKRHLITDTQGLLLAVRVHAANEHDSKAAFEVMEQLKWRCERMKKSYADGGYRGELVDRVKNKLGYQMETLLFITDFGINYLPLPPIHPSAYKRWRKTKAYAMSFFKTVFFAILGLFVAAQVGCSPDHSSETPEVGKVTFIFYGQADQGIAPSLAARFFDLHKHCTKDYRALSMLNFPEAFRPLMAQGFGVEKIGTLTVASNGLSDKTVIVENSTDRTIDMSDPATLTRLIDLAAKTFPAEQYVILFSGHGTGWRFDDDGKKSAAAGDETLPGITLAAATKALDDCSIKGKIKLIHFESCLMMGHEYITALAPYAPYIMGTATASWGVQHLIDQLVTLIQQNDNWETVCQKYVAYGMTHPQLKNTYWMVPMAVRTAEVAALLPTIKTMNNAIISYCNLGETERLQVRELFIFETHLYDDAYSLADLNDFYFRLTLLNPVFAQPYGVYKSVLGRFVLAAGDTNGTERKSAQQRASGNTTYSPSILCPSNNEEYQKLKESRYNELLFVRETLTDQLYSVLYR